MELQKDPSIFLMGILPSPHRSKASSELGPPCFPCLHPKEAAIHPAASSEWGKECSPHAHCFPENLDLPKEQILSLRILCLWLPLPATTA